MHLQQPIQFNSTKEYRKEKPWAEMLVNTPIIQVIHQLFNHQFRDPVVNKDAKEVSLQVRFATGGAPECKEALI